MSSRREKYFGGDVAALAILYSAWRQAVEKRTDPWQHAVQFPSLGGVGIHCADLNRLLGKGLIAHAEEYTERGVQRRLFRPRLGCAWTAQSCFVLTTDGLGLFGGPRVNRTPGWLDPRLTPIWDGATRELSGGGWPTKRYTGPAKNQITVLEAFQEEGWPRHIFDPLPRAKAPDRSRHLRDAVRLLNRHQIVPLIRFESDGMGEGIRWHWALPRRLPRRLVK